MKVHKIKTRESRLQQYRKLCYGEVGWGAFLRAELTLGLLSGMPGALGIWLRSRLYPGLFGACGRGVIFGRHITFRHPRKIRLGDHVILDDQCMLDAKGETNRGITLGQGVYIGRHTLVYCKNGNIELGDGCNISSNCTLFSANQLTLEAGVLIAGYAYLLSGGTYDYRDTTPFVEQSGQYSRGPLTVGTNCWLGARATVLDGASIGEHCVIGAGALVTRPVPPHSLATGVPARVVKSLNTEA